MKKNLLVFFAAAVFAACNNKEAAMLTFQGTVKGDNVSLLYLYSVENQHYNIIKLIDSIAVTDGKFTYSNDSLQTRLYFLSTEGDRLGVETFERGTYLFLQKEDNNAEISMNTDKKMRVKIEKSLLQNRFAEFADERERISSTPFLDSLNQLFFAARERGDKNELIRIKTLSAPYYDEVYKKMGEFIDTTIKENKGSLFGLYLFYTYRFQNMSFSTAEDIVNLKKRLENLDDESRQSIYFTKISDTITILENCAVGHEAPEITGLDTLGNEIKLSDFRGKYVLVDFWSSGCSWCRKETPNFQKTFDTFKNKNLVIFGVSSDHKKEDWLEAIRKDKSYWTQIMMRQEDMRKIINSYAIVSIPEILLVDPQGIILAKGLRGQDIYNTVSNYLK